jgi:hypothetical protein
MDRHGTRAGRTTEAGSRPPFCFSWFAQPSGVAPSVDWLGPRCRRLSRFFLATSINEITVDLAVEHRHRRFAHGSLTGRSGSDDSLFATLGSHVGAALPHRWRNADRGNGLDRVSLKPFSSAFYRPSIDCDRRNRKRSASILRASRRVFDWTFRSFRDCPHHIGRESGRVRRALHRWLGSANNRKLECWLDCCRLFLLCGSNPCLVAATNRATPDLHRPKTENCARRSRNELVGAISSKQQPVEVLQASANWRET